MSYWNQLQGYSAGGTGPLLEGSALDSVKPPVVPDPDWAGKRQRGEPMQITTWSRTFHNEVQNVAQHYEVKRIRKSDGQEDVHGLLGTYNSNIKRSFTYPTLTSLGVSIPAMAAKAVNRAKNAAWDISTFAVEADKTHDLLAKAHTSWRRRAEDIKRQVLKYRNRSRFVNYALVLRHFTEAWMETRYGWRILMYDLEAAQDSLTRFRERNKLERYTVTEDFNAPTELSSAQGQSVWLRPNEASGHTTPYSNNTTTTTVEHTARVRVGAGVSVTSSYEFTINPLLTVWEVIPFSFIADWFVNVGDVIGAHTPTFGRELAYVWVSVHRTTTLSTLFTWTPVPETSTYRYVGTSGTGFHVTQRVDFERYPLTGFSFGLSFNPNLSLAKFTDLAALAYGYKYELFKSLLSRR